MITAPEILVSLLRNGAIKNRKNSGEQTSSYDAYGQILDKREPKGCDQDQSRAPVAKQIEKLPLFRHVPANHHQQASEG